MYTLHRYKPIRMLYTQCIDKLMHPPSALQQWQTRLTNNRHYCRLPKQENVGKHTHTYTAHINIHTIHCTNDRHNAPMTDTIADSPKQKKPSGMPQARFQWKTTTKFEMPSAVQMIVPLSNLVFIIKQKNERMRNSIHKTEEWKNSEQGDSYENAPKVRNPRECTQSCIYIDARTYMYMCMYIHTYTNIKTCSWDLWVISTRTRTVQAAAPLSLCLALSYMCGVVVVISTRTRTVHAHELDTHTNCTKSSLSLSLCLALSRFFSLSLYLSLFRSFSLYRFIYFSLSLSLSLSPSLPHWFSPSLSLSLSLRARTRALSLPPSTHTLTIAEAAGKEHFSNTTGKYAQKSALQSLHIVNWVLRISIWKSTILHRNS